MARSRRRKKKSLLGFWVLEAIVVIGFSALLMNARAIRESAGIETGDSRGQVSFVESQTEESQNGWENHRPRFSQVVGELWNNGF